jgi:hypothetical protein
MNALQLSKMKCGLKLERERECGLCNTIYKPINLILAVPRKAVLDIRESWGEKYDPVGSEKLKADVSTIRLLKLPSTGAIYDEVRVCAFCSQLFEKQQENYRPSWEAREADRILKEANERERLEKARWDPLKTVEVEREKENEEWREAIRRAEEEEAKEEEERRLQAIENAERERN